MAFDNYDKTSLVPPIVCDVHKSYDAHYDVSICLSY